MLCESTLPERDLKPASAWTLVLDVPVQWAEGQWGGGELIRISSPVQGLEEVQLSEQVDDAKPDLAKRKSSICRGLLKPVVIVMSPSSVDSSAPNDVAPLALLAAQIEAEMGWPSFYMNYDMLPLAEQLRPWSDALHPSPASCTVQRHDAASWVQAVGAALGLTDAVLTPHTALLTLEALAIVELRAGGDPLLDYPFAIPRLLRGGQAGLPYIEPLAMWQALLGDCVLQTPPSLMAARFLRGWVNSLARLVDQAITAEQEGMQASAHIRGQHAKEPVVRIMFNGALFDNLWLTRALETALITRGYEIDAHLQPSPDSLAWPDPIRHQASG